VSAAFDGVGCIERGAGHSLLQHDGGYIGAINTEALEEVFSVSQSEPDYVQIEAHLGHMTDGSLPPGPLLRVTVRRRRRDPDSVHPCVGRAPIPGRPAGGADAGWHG
jgi:hypothetical protein